MPKKKSPSVRRELIEMTVIMRACAICVVSLRAEGVD